MSELIDNRKHRQEVLKGIIRDIHAGANVDDVKDRFAELLSQVGAAEISAIEQALIDEGCRSRRYKLSAVFMFRSSVKA